MKIIFIDHDGPMVIPGLPYYQTIFDDKNKSYFDPDAVKILNEILEKTDAEIVVSSMWRVQFNLKNLGNLYEEANILKKPMDITPILSNAWLKDHKLYDLSLDQIRSYEIELWLQENVNKNVTHWVAVDDLYLTVKNFVLTDEGILGITESGTKEKILQFLI